MFVFSMNFFPWLSDVCNIMKLPYISLIVDSPVLTLYSNSLQNAYNRIFIFDKTLFNEFFKLNPNNIFHIPLATNVSRTDELINNSSNSVKQQFACDISFIGSTYQ
jgi:spore maturation protein CgeB